MSKQILGVFIAGAGALLIGFGFSDSCSNEIMAKALPFLGTLPGLALTYFARLAKGDVKFSGLRKR